MGWCIWRKSVKFYNFPPKIMRTNAITLGTLPVGSKLLNIHAGHVEH